MKKKPVHYVDNKLLYAEMTKYIAACRDATVNAAERPRIPDYIGTCIYKTAYRLATKPNFSSYSYKDDMISDGIITCCRYIHNFDPEKSTNPFSYFTQIIYFAFLQRIEKEKKHAYIKQKSIEMGSVMGLLANQPFEGVAQNGNGPQIDTSKIADFELKNNIKPGKPSRAPRKSKTGALDKFIEEIAYEC